MNKKILLLFYLLFVNPMSAQYVSPFDSIVPKPVFIANPSLGQKPQSGSLPVVISSDQSTLPVSVLGGNVTISASVGVSVLAGVTVTNGGVSLLAGTSNIGGVSVLAPVTVGAGGVSLLTGTAAIGSVSVSSGGVSLLAGVANIGGVSVLGTAGVSVTNSLAIGFSDNGPLTFTAAGVPAAVPVTLTTTQGRMKCASLQVKGAGNPTSWDIRIEVSIDGINYSQLLAHTNVAPADGNIISTGAVLTPFRFYQVRCAGLVLGPGTGVVVNVTVMP